MNNSDLVLYTDTVPVIDKKGRKIDEIRLGEKVKPVPRRRCCVSDNGLFYKGAGIIYTGHFANTCDDDVKLREETGVIYEKYNVVYPSLYRRFGIFTFQHQPVFSDNEGGCGRKEKNLLVLQKEFLYSAIEEIVDIIDVPLDDHAIYVYRSKDLKGNYKDTLNLIEYILSGDYNTAWDKNLWDDIACFGYVRDLADWYKSGQFAHKLGTVYGLLTALIKKDKYTYEKVVRELTGLEQLGDHHIVYIAALIVKKFAPGCVPQVDLDRPNKESYEFLWTELYSGKACCHLEKEEEWGFVRGEWKKKVPENAALAVKDLQYHKIMTVLQSKR